MVLKVIQISHLGVSGMGVFWDGYMKPYMEQHIVSNPTLFFSSYKSEKKKRKEVGIIQLIKLSCVNSFSTIVHTKTSCLGMQRDVCKFKIISYCYLITTPKLVTSKLI